MAVGLSRPNGTIDLGRLVDPAAGTSTRQLSVAHRGNRLRQTGRIDANRIDPQANKILRDFRIIRRCLAANANMVKVVKREGTATPIPEVIATYPGERTTPPCNKQTYDD